MKTISSHFILITLAFSSLLSGSQTRKCHRRKKDRRKRMFTCSSLISEDQWLSPREKPISSHPITGQVLHGYIEDTGGPSPCSYVLPRKSCREKNAPAFTFGSRCLVEKSKFIDDQWQFARKAISTNVSCRRRFSYRLGEAMVCSFESLHDQSWFQSWKSMANTGRLSTCDHFWCSTNESELSFVVDRYAPAARSHVHPRHGS